MVTKTPENIREVDMREDIKGNLTGLRIDVKDQKKFEALSKDSNVQSGIEKIIEKGLSFKIKNFEKTYNMYTKESVDYYTCDFLLKKRPDLLSLIGWDLHLPVDRSKKIKFSELSLEQKLGFMALMNVYWDYSGNWFRKSTGSGFENTKIENIISKYAKYRDDFAKEAAENLNSQMENNKVIGNLTKYEKVMKTYYGLTDDECKKVWEYLELIVKHPEYVGGKMKLNTVGACRWLLKGLIKWGLIIGIPFIAGYKLKEYRDKVYSIEESKMKESENGKVTVSFTDVMQELPGYAKISNDTLTYEKEAYGYYDDKSGMWIEKQFKKGINWVRKQGNKVQKRKVTVESDIEVGYFYNGKKMSIDIEKKDGKGYITIRLQEDPKLKVTDRKIKTVGKAQRELFHKQSLDDFDFEVAEKVDSTAMSHAASRQRREMADSSLMKNTLEKFKKHGYYTDELQINAKDFVGVSIVYEGEAKDPKNLPDAHPDLGAEGGWKHIDGWKDVK